MKAAVIVCDGIADRPIKELDKKKLEMKCDLEQALTSFLVKDRITLRTSPQTLPKTHKIRNPHNFFIPSSENVQIPH